MSACHNSYWLWILAGSSAHERLIWGWLTLVNIGCIWSCSIILSSIIMTILQIKPDVTVDFASCSISVCYFSSRSSLHVFLKRGSHLLWLPCKNFLSPCHCQIQQDMSLCPLQTLRNNLSHMPRGVLQPNCNWNHTWNCILHTETQLRGNFELGKK